MSIGEFKYMKEGITIDLVDLLMKDFNLDYKGAMGVLYDSDLYARLCDPATGLYYQSPLYVYSFLKSELKKGVLS